MSYQPLDCNDLVEICEGIHDEDVIHEVGKDCPECIELMKQDDIMFAKLHAELQISGGTI